MAGRELLYTVEIPEYPRLVKVSESARVKPFIRGQKVPKKYLDKIGTDYEWKSVNVIRKGRKVLQYHLYEIDTGEIISSNPDRAGKPRFEKISGNAIYSCNMHHATRDKYMQAIQLHFMKYVDIHISDKITKFPIVIDGYLYDTKKDEFGKSGAKWDLDNRQYFYNKAFLDVLTGIKVRAKGFSMTTKGRIVIPDDDYEFVSGPPRLIFRPIKDTNKRKIVYNIYKDDYEHYNED